MSEAGFVTRQVVLEQKRFWRSRGSALFTFAFPVLLLVIVGSLNQGDRERSLGFISFNQYYVPAIVAFGVMSSCFANVALNVVTRRDSGVLKRLRGTPMRPIAFVSALLGSALLVALLLTIVTIVIGIVAFDVTVYADRLGALLVSVVTGAAAFGALGVALSTFVSNADAAPAVVNAVYFPVSIISGVFFPLRNGTVLHTVASVLPLYHLVLAMFATFDPRRTGSPFALGDLLIVVAWGCVGLVVAVRRFRWEPAV